MPARIGYGWLGHIRRDAKFLPRFGLLMTELTVETQDACHDLAWLRLYTPNLLLRGC